MNKPQTVIFATTYTTNQQHYFNIDMRDLENHPSKLVLSADSNA
ncbi:hypothetical protein URH17368_2148 [Alicyclobacillus hesperidum URH17-3-68]|nr:hypothetical protein URH17368_2148 [Alicyclobacillus hesperidum URH17-3-68]